MSKPRGRPGFIVTPEVLQQVEEWAARGVPEYQMAKNLGIHRTTFIKHKSENDELKAACENGKVQVQSWAAGKLVAIMMDDNHSKQFSALQFYLKTQCGWSDNKVVTQNGPTPPGSIRFTMDEDDE